MYIHVHMGKPFVSFMLELCVPSTAWATQIDGESAYESSFYAWALWGLFPSFSAACFSVLQLSDKCDLTVFACKKTLCHPVDLPRNSRAAFSPGKSRHHGKIRAWRSTHFGNSHGDFLLHGRSRVARRCNNVEPLDLPPTVNVWICESYV